MKSMAWALSLPVAATLILSLWVTETCAQEEDHWTDRITLKGDLRLRYEAIDKEGEEVRSRGRYRARLAFSANVIEDVKVVFQLASGADDPVSRNQTFGGGFSTKDFGLDLVYVDWAVKDKVHLYGGKMKNPLFRPASTSLIWDSDFNPEGVAASFKSDMFFGTAGIFAVEERSSSDDSLLYALQGGLRFKLSDTGKLSAGLGYFEYTNTIGNEPFYNGRPKGNSVDVDGNLIFDYKQLELFAQYDTMLGELPFTVYADFVQNTEVDVNDTGYAFGMKVGEAQAPGTWQALWAYQYIEADPIIATFNDSDFGQGGTDATGHILKATYALNENLALGGTLFINKVETNAGSELDYSRLQLDIEFKF